ncbi:MAG: hypothetical protein J6B75_10210 [Ruminococcus sp.]|nr:hypothetical protein [Ruminococcus sp.]
MRKDKIKTLLIIVVLAAVVWFGVKWFAGLANDNTGNYDGGMSQAEEQIEDQ